MARTQNILRYIVFLYLFIPSLIYAIPRVINVTSIDGYYKPGDIIPIYVTFNESIDLCGDPYDAYIQLNSGGSATLVAKSGANTAVFNYVVQIGHNSPDLGYAPALISDPNIQNIIPEGGVCSYSVQYNKSLPTPTQPGSLDYNNNVVVDSGPYDMWLSCTVSESNYLGYVYNNTVNLSFYIGYSPYSQMNLSATKIYRAYSPFINGSCSNFTTPSLISSPGIESGSVLDVFSTPVGCIRYHMFVSTVQNTYKYIYCTPIVFTPSLPFSWISPMDGENIYFKNQLNISWNISSQLMESNCLHNVSLILTSNQTKFSIANLTPNSTILWQPPVALPNGWYNLSVESTCFDQVFYNSRTVRKIESFLPKKTATNKTYIETFISKPITHIVGNDELGEAFSAILLVGFFLAFVSFQNIRVEGKVVVLIPALILATVYIGWLFTLIALGVGVLFYLALGRLFNK